MSLLALLTLGSPPGSTMPQRALTLGDWFIGQASYAQPVTNRRRLRFPHGARVGWRLYLRIGSPSTDARVDMRIEGGPTITVGGVASWQPVAGYHLSDPIPVSVPVGGELILRQRLTGTTVPLGGYPQAADGIEGWNFGDLYSADGTAGLLTTGNGPCLYPTAIGQPQADGPSLMIVGDSIIAGPSSFPETASRGAGVAGFSIAQGGDTGDGTQGNYATRLGPGLTSEQFTHVLHQHNINDTAAGWPAVRAERLDSWVWARGLGLIPIQLTCTPWTSSTDNWATEANQSPAGNSATIQLLNAWLRDGAPLVAGAPADTGTVGALRAGDPGHPCALIWDTAAAVQATSNPALARIGCYSSGDGVHPNATGHGYLAADLQPRLAAL